MATRSVRKVAKFESGFIRTARNRHKVGIYLVIRPLRRFIRLTWASAHDFDDELEW